MVIVFFFQAEDGIRDKLVTGVQTCALPICTRCNDPSRGRWPVRSASVAGARADRDSGALPAKESSRDQRGLSVSTSVRSGPGPKIGRASCRESAQVSARDGRPTKQAESEMV